MFRAVGSVLKRNKEALYGIARGSTTCSHRVFTSHITASSSPLAGNSLHGLRSLLKGQNASMFRNMSTVAAISSESKEGLKLLVTGGPQARKWVGMWLFGSPAWVFSMVVLGGVSTLLSYVPVSLGSAHQAGALTLLTLMLLLNHTLRKPSPSLLKSLPQVAKSTFS